MEILGVVRWQSCLWVHRRSLGIPHPTVSGGAGLRTSYHHRVCLAHQWLYELDLKVYPLKTAILVRASLLT